MKSLKSLVNKMSRRKYRRSNSKSDFTSFQLLEDRRMLATFTVTNTAASGPGSLPQAVVEANNSVGADTINFDASVFTEGGNNLIRLTNGQLEVTESLTISAPLSLGVTITGDANGDDITTAGNITDVAASFGGIAGAADDLLDDNSRVLNFSAETGVLTLEGLTITGGRTTGDNSLLRETTNDGAGVRSVFAGDVVLIDSNVSGNSTAGESANGAGIGGYLGSLTLTRTTVTNNVTTGLGADGGGIFQRDGSVELVDSTVSGNTAADSGGGISAWRLAGGNPVDVVTLTNSTVSGNTAGRSGGGISTSTSLTLTSSTVSENTAGFDGGGISSNASVTLTSSTVSGNTAGRDGGGVEAFSVVTLNNSTLARNNASGSGGGISIYAGAVSLNNSTISGNTSQFASGIYAYYVPAMLFVPNNVVDARNSIVAGNSISGFDVVNESSIIGGDIATIFETEVVDGATVPLLADNGGPVETIALLESSPAIDAGDNSLVFDSRGDELLTDQRGTGFDRIVEGTVDIGAFEFDASTFLLGDVNQDGVVNFLDISPFIFVLQFNEFQDEADVNGDGEVNFLDISPFINVLATSNS